MAKRKSWYDIDKQATELVKRAGYGTPRARLIRQIADMYKENIRKSAQTEKYERDLSEARGNLIVSGRAEDYAYRSYRGTTPPGGPDPDEYDYDLDGVFPKLETKWKRYHHTPSVYRDGNRENVAVQSAFSNTRQPISTQSKSMSSIAG